jgi:hypothetical protein
MVDEIDTPSIQEIREEIISCIDLINSGSAVSAVTRLTQLGCRLKEIKDVEPVPEGIYRKGNPGKKPLYIWEHEDSLQP